MRKIHVIFHDAGGGHRNAAVALQTMATQQQRPWQVELVQFQELTDRFDVLRRLTGIRIQEQYNVLLQNGWTLGSVYLTSAASHHSPFPSSPGELARKF